jgi:DNA-binding CsgD family transcriptional regulator
MESESLQKMKCKLSAREMTILDSFISGVSAARQATLLGITLKTLYQHRKNCANKLGLSNLKELLYM